MKLLTSGYQLCYECHRRIIPVVEIGTMDDHGHVDQGSGGTFCLECLRKAVALLEAVLGSAGAAWEMDVAFPRGATDPNAPADVVFSAFSASGTEEE